MKRKKINFQIFLLYASIIMFLIYGCYEHFPLDQDISRTQNEFLNQDSVTVSFPEISKGKITLLTMIYTNCPDICPMTTHNMHLIEEKLPDEVLEKIRIVVISFDPERDTPSVLKKYAELRDYNLSRWTFLSGSAENTKEVMLKLDIKAIKTDSSFSEDGMLSYSIIHTDRLSLIDEDGKLKKTYKGSIANISEAIEDIIYLNNN